MGILNSVDKREFLKLLRRLERIRAEMGWTQTRMAGICGVTQASYCRWIKHKNCPTPLALEGLQSRMPVLFAELAASRRKLDLVMQEIENLRGGE